MLSLCWQNLPTHVALLFSNSCLFWLTTQSAALSAHFTAHLQRNDRITRAVRAAPALLRAPAAKHLNAQK